MAEFGGEYVRPTGGRTGYHLAGNANGDVSPRHTFKVVNLRLKLLFPRTMVPEHRHNLVVAATITRGTCLVLFECGQQGGEVDAGYGHHMRRILQRHQCSLAANVVNFWNM